MMLIWPANSWVFWGLVAVALILFLRFGIFSRREAKSSRTRLYVLSAIATVLIVICAALPSIVFAALTSAGASADSIDIALWSLAAAFALGAIAFACLGLFGDRSRGRKRCPKCWYDMSGSPTLTCPECGKVAKSQRKLLKTRRRWSIVVLASVLLVMGAATAVAPKVRDNTWPALLPDIAIIAAAPFEFGGEALQRQIDLRVAEWNYAERDTEVGLLRRTITQWAVRLSLSDPANVIVTGRGIQLAWSRDQDTPAVRSRMVQLAEGQHIYVSDLPLYWLAEHAPEDERAQKLIAAALKVGDSTTIRVLVLHLSGLTVGEGEFDPVPDRMLDLSHHERDAVRLVVTDYVGMFEESTELADWRERALADECLGVRVAAIKSLLQSEHADERVINGAIDALRHGDPLDVFYLLEAIAESDCQNERIWRTFAPALARDPFQYRFADLLLTVARTPSEVRIDALLTLGEYRVVWLRIAEALQRVTEFKPHHIVRMRTLAADWRDRGNTQAADAMDIAIKHAESTPTSTDASIAP